MQNQSNLPPYIANQPLSIVPITMQQANRTQIVLTPISRNLVKSPLSVSGVNPIQIVYPYTNQIHQHPQTVVNQKQPIEINTKPPEKLVLNKENVFYETEKKPKQLRAVAKNVVNEPTKSPIRLIRNHEKETFKDGVIIYNIFIA
jgi:hypothetical protein